MKAPVNLYNYVYITYLEKRHYLYSILLATMDVRYHCLWLILSFYI